MNEFEAIALVLFALVLWNAFLHWRIWTLDKQQDKTSDHLRGVADQANRLQRELRGR